MTVCPVALVVGCNKCPVVKMCPLKQVLGDYVKQDQTEEAASQEEPPTDQE